MIDPTDKTTQSLELDEQPARKRRGRPSTGQALSNAERQRLYRERQKAQRNEKQDAANHATVQALDHEVRKLLIELEKAQTRVRELEAQLAEREKPARTKRHRDETPNVLKQYHAQDWDAKARKWRTIGSTEPDNEPFDDWQKAEDFVKRLLKNGSKSRYRIVPAHLPVLEYK